MCFNAPLSMVVFIFGLMTTIKLFMKGKEGGEDGRKYIAAGCMMISLSLMQLIEFFLWTYKNPNTKSHQFWSIAIMAGITLQGVLSYASFKALNLIPEKYDAATTTIFALFLAIFVYFIVTVFVPQFGTFDSRSSYKKFGNCRLNWDAMTHMGNKNFPLYFIYFVFYYLLLTFFTYILFGPNGVYVLLSTILFTVGVSMIQGSGIYKVAIGSSWCLLALVAACIIILFVDKLFPTTPLIADFR